MCISSRILKLKFGLNETEGPLPLTFYDSLSLFLFICSLEFLLVREGSSNLPLYLSTYTSSYCNNMS